MGVHGIFTFSCVNKYIMKNFMYISKLLSFGLWQYIVRVHTSQCMCDAACTIRMTISVFLRECLPYKLTPEAVTRVYRSW